MKNCFSSRMWLPAALSLCALAVSTSPSALAGEVVLQDDQVTVAFDSDSGALTRLEDKDLNWTVERRPELAASFRINTLLPDNSVNAIQGQKQHAEVTKVSDNEVRLQWKDLTSEKDGVLPITLTVDVTLTNGTLMFSPTVANDSSLMVESVDYPCLGDLNPPAAGVPMQVKHMWYAGLPSQDIMNSPTVETKQSLFALVQAPDQGLYIEMHDATEPYLIRFLFNRRGSNRSGKNPARIEFHASHIAYVHPHTTRTLAPVVVQGYHGDWHAGVDIYKQWRATWFKAPHLPDWIKDVNTWQQLQINTPEQDFRVPYTNLLAYGEECASNGVNAIQLVGWNHEGQDGGDPAQDIDPGLGTWQELHDAIAQIQARGVKIILFAKLNWADLTTAWYTNELYKYQCTDPEGNRYEQGGYSYVTPTQLAGIGVHRRAVMDFNDPAYQAVALQEFKKILALGSEGWLWDEVCHHAGVEYSYATNHGYEAPGFIYGGDMPIGSELRAAADQVNPDFVFAGEGPEDWLLQYFPCSYFRIGADSTPVARYIDSQEPLMVAVTGFDDREMLNLILMDRYIISYEPYNFKGHVTDYPLTLAYGKKIEALRRKYKAYLWDAEFRDTLGATVTAPDAAPGMCRYTVFVAGTGKRAVVLVNLDQNKAITATVQLPNPGTLVVATPEAPEAQPTTGTVVIPARCAAVVMEQ